MSNFDSKTCGRCSGKGRGDWAPQMGICHGCNGAGEVLTSKGRTDRAAWIEAHTMRVTVADLKAGDVVLFAKILGQIHPGLQVYGRRQIAAVEPTNYDAETVRLHPDHPTHKVIWAKGGADFLSGDRGATIWVEA